MRNNFDRQKLKDYFLYNYACWVCGGNRQDAFHHITGRDSSSILNAAPVHNDKCHLMKSGWLHKFEVEVMLLKKTWDYLVKQGYILSAKDKEYIRNHKKHYDKIDLGITQLAML